MALQRLIFCGLVLGVAFLLPGCGSREQPQKVIDINDGYISNERENCDEKIGINGTWRLIFKQINGKDSTLPSNLTLVIKDCSLIQCYSSGSLIKQEYVKMFRELKYCDDYQLLYTKNDSTSCVNFRKDTLIFGACSSYETTETNKYFFKRG